MKRLLLAAIALLALSAAAPARAEWPLLGASTTIDGTSTGFAEVHVPHAVALTSSDGHWLPKVRLSGHGRLYGVVLRRDEPDSRSPFTLMNTSGDGDGDPPELELHQRGGFTDGAEQPVMPAGDYRLYLLADGKPVHAEVLVPGLDGQASLAPQVPVPQQIAELPRADPGGPAAIFAGEGALASKGLVVVRPHATSALDLYRRSEVCTYGPDDGATTTASFAPGCGDPIWLLEDLAYDGPGELTVPPGASERGFEAWVTDASPGRWSVGGNVADAGLPGTVEMLGAWISYEPAPGTPLPSRPGDPAPPAPSAPASAPSTTPTAPAPVAARPKSAKKKKKRKHRRHKHRHKRHHHRAKKR